MKNVETKYFGLIPISLFLFLILVIVVVMSQAQIGGATTEFLKDQQSAKEYFWRLFWSTLLVIIVLYSIVMIWYAIKVLRENLVGFNDNAIRELSWGMVGIIGVVVAFLVFSDPTFSVVRYFLLENSDHAYMYDLVRFLFGISSGTVMLVTFSMCFVILEDHKLDIKIVQIKNRAFKRSFYITAGYLGIGVVHFYSLFMWASYSRGILEQHKILTNGVIIAASMLYTLIFIVMFVPVSIRMRSWIERLAINDGVDIYNLEEMNKFKKSNGLYDSPRNNVKQLVVLLSPAVVGILSGVIGQLVQIKTTGS